MITSHHPAAGRPRALLVAGAALLLAIGCVSASSVNWNETGRPAGEVPARFVADTSAAAAPAGAQGCLVRLMDPRDGTRLTLQQSAETLGDYRVEAGRYGVRAGEWLRVECATGRAVGIVPATR